MAVTRTYGQLHFLDLGWERFESLVEGIVFKWRRWESINHPGVAGSDDGIDIEAVELLENGKQCVYHFQCKRYEKLNATGIRKILNDYCDKNLVKSDKYVLVTACSLSASCLNVLKEHAKLKGFKSCTVWTKSELESMLFTQFYDLLYIFFGISVVKQRNNRISTIRRNISFKNKMRQDFIMPINEWKQKYEATLNGKDWHMYRIEHPYSKFISSKILVRSIDDTTYPDQDKSLPRGHFSYEKMSIYDFYHNGIIVYAYPYSQDIIVRQTQFDEKGFLFYSLRATVLGFIPYNNIIDYDIDGDEYYNYPHVFCDFANGTDPFEYIRYAVETEFNSLSILKDDEVSEVSKKERLDNMTALFAVDYEEPDDYCGTILCSDCNKEMNVDINTKIDDGAWGVRPVAKDTLEIGNEVPVCYSCYKDHCLKINTKDWEQLLIYKENIEKEMNSKLIAGKKETVENCLYELTNNQIKNGKLVRKSNMARQLCQLLEITGTQSFNDSINTFVNWYKLKLL